MIVDDHPIVREGIKLLLQQDPTLEFCGEAEDYADAVDQLERQQPDIAIVDITLKQSSGLDFIKTARTLRPGLKILVLSIYDESLYAERVLRAGAHGYLMKHQAMINILEGIHRVLDGELCISEHVTRRLLARIVNDTPPVDDPTDCLSDRELEVFRLYGQGRSTREIATHLQLSVKTIESHREHILQKLNLKNSAEMVRRAVEFVLRRENG
jgi:DNA-binding NarL/FixJ family response regulator